MRNPRTPTPRTTMPTWDGRPDTALDHLTALEQFLRRGESRHGAHSGVSAEEIARLAQAAEAQLAAIFNQWRAETRARLGIGA